MGTYTTNYNLFMPTVGEQGWGTLVNGNFTTIDTAMKGLDTRLTAVENEVNGNLSCTSVTTSGTITSTGKITANGGIGTKALTATSISNSGTLTQTGTSTFTGLITANGGIKGNLTGNVTGNISGLISRAMTISTSAPYTHNNVVIYTIQEMKYSRSTGSSWTDKTQTIPALKTSYTTPWGSYSLSRPTALSVTFNVHTSSQYSTKCTIYFDNVQKIQLTGTDTGTFTVSINTTTSHTLKMSIESSPGMTCTVKAVPFYLK